MTAIFKAFFVVFLYIGLSACASQEHSAQDASRQETSGSPVQKAPAQDDSAQTRTPANTGSSKYGRPSNTEQTDELSDPWQGFNRKILSFNLWADRWILNPTSKVYHAVTPKFVRTGVNNFSGNLGELSNALNSLLQFEINNMGSALGRFGINSTIGIFGLFDPATHFGVTAYREDFGQTFAVWGVPAGPYVVLPFLGPSTLRGVAGLPANFTLDPVDELPIENLGTAKQITAGLSVLDIRRRRAKVFELLNSSIDPYTNLKTFWWANRVNEINNGRPPQKKKNQDNNSEEFDELDDFDDLESAEEN